MKITITWSFGISVITSVFLQSIYEDWKLSLGMFLVMTSISALEGRNIIEAKTE